jgi:hypothetical protein
MIEGAELSVLRHQLLSDLDRWESELTDPRRIRGTLWYGIFGKACNATDELIVLTTRMVLCRAGDAGQLVLAGVGKGKPVARFTLGQQLEVLKGLQANHLLSPPFGKRDGALFERVVKGRNDFAHGRVAHDKSGIDVTLVFIDAVRYLCRTSIVEALCIPGSDEQ